MEESRIRKANSRGGTLEEEQGVVMEESRIRKVNSRGGTLEETQGGVMA